MTAPLSGVQRARLVDHVYEMDRRRPTLAADLRRIINLVDTYAEIVARFRDGETTSSFDEVAGGAPARWFRVAEDGSILHDPMPADQQQVLYGDVVAPSEEPADG